MSHAMNEGKLKRIIESAKNATIQCFKEQGITCNDLQQLKSRDKDLLQLIGSKPIGIKLNMIALRGELLKNWESEIGRVKVFHDRASALAKIGRKFIRSEPYCDHIRVTQPSHSHQGSSTDFRLLLNDQQHNISAWTGPLEQIIG